MPEEGREVAPRDRATTTATKAALDAALVAYFGAYEAPDVRAELQAARDGRLGLARARRPLATRKDAHRRAVPAEFEATLGVEGVSHGHDDGAPGVLRAARRAPSRRRWTRRRRRRGRRAAEARARLDALRDLQALGVRSGLAARCGVRRGRPHPVPARRRPSRRRGGHAGEGRHGLLAAAPAGTGGARRARPRDPILWFAALPPQPLRQAQARFRRAVDLIVELEPRRADGRRAAAAEALKQSWEPVVSRKDAIAGRQSTPHAKPVQFSTSSGGGGAPKANASSGGERDAAGQ